MIWLYFIAQAWSLIMISQTSSLCHVVPSSTVQCSVKGVSFDQLVFMIKIQKNASRNAKNIWIVKSLIWRLATWLGLYLNLDESGCSSLSDFLSIAFPTRSTSGQIQIAIAHGLHGLLGDGRRSWDKRMVKHGEAHLGQVIFLFHCLLNGTKWPKTCMLLMTNFIIVRHGHTGMDP